MKQKDRNAMVSMDQDRKIRREREKLLRSCANEIIELAVGVKLASAIGTNVRPETLARLRTALAGVERLASPSWYKHNAETLTPAEADCRERLLTHD